MKNRVLLKRVNATTRIVFEDPGGLCLVVKGRISTASPGLRREMGPGGVIDASTYAYAIESSELLFITLEKIRALKPDIAAKITTVMKVEASAPRLPKQERTAYTYGFDVQCPACGDHFQATKLFESKLKQLSHDTEMRTRFENIEPIHYKVWVCPDCLYADFANRWSDLSDAKKAALKESIASREGIRKDLPEPGGSAEKSVNDYRLLIECQTQTKAAANVIGSAWLNLAWLYDDLGAAEAATDARKNSLTAYEGFYLLERSLSPSLDAQALYIIGELHKRLGNVKQAREYFLKVLQNKEHNTGMLVELARDSLQNLKQIARETA
jgi:uncharacterized protein (DUF2225 family)